LSGMKNPVPRARIFYLKTFGVFYMIPLNVYLVAYILIYVLSVALYLAIDQLNIRYLRNYGQKVPAPFEGMIDEKELQEISQYTSDNIGFNLVETTVSKTLFLFIVLSGILPWLAGSLAQVNFLLAGLVFFAVPGFIEGIAGLPFDYYHSFVLEDKYGFNTKTIKIWFADLVKSLIVVVILGSLLLSALLLMLAYTGEMWWVCAWIVLLCFQLIMTVLYPTVIAPLFNTFTPLEDSELKVRIQQLADEEGLNVTGIYQMDASKRTRHTNAYLSGLGKAKRIVLFDSLIRSHDLDEVVAILAHEIGHLKKNHIKKQLVITSILSLFLFYLASKLLTLRSMYESFGFFDMPHYVGLFLVSVLWGPISSFLSPMGMAISRKFEKEADLYAFQKLKSAKPLASALKKMAKENLSNLTPHRLYVWFNYSHPPLLERVQLLEGLDLTQRHASEAKKNQ
jgi:STE24 endopeptidase